MNTSSNTGGEQSPLSYFYNLHQGQTCLLLGNGPSLNDIPIGLLEKYISIGSNTIVKGHIIPDYYVAVDHRVYREFSDDVNRKYRSVPKFLLSPKLDDWKGENIYRFTWSVGYSMVAQITLAKFMGFSKMLMVGVDHTLHTKEHFWGVDDGMPGTPNVSRLEERYAELRDGVVNISTFSLLPESIIPKENWKQYA